MFQAKQLLLRYEKRPPDQLKMYPATANALTHETQLVTAQAKKSTACLTNNAYFVNNQSYSEEYFAGKCYTCGSTGHRSQNCQLVNVGQSEGFQKWQQSNGSRNREQSIDRRSLSRSPSRNRSPSPYQKNQRNQRYKQNNERYDHSPSPYPRDRSRSRDSDRDKNPDRRSYYEPNPSQPFRNIHNKSVANSTTTLQTQQQEEVPTAQSSFRRPPEWELLERQEKESQRNQPSRKVELTDKDWKRNNASTTHEE